MHRITRHITARELDSLYQTIHSFTVFFIILVIVSCVGLVVLVTVLIRMSLSKRHEKESAEYASHVITAQEEERSRLSAELHDTVAQDLCVALSMAHDENQRELLRSSIAQIRSMCYTLVPPAIAKQSLSSILQTICLNFLDETKLDVHFLLRDDAKKLLDSQTFPVQKKLNVYRIVQESLVNTRKHANATEVSVFARREQKNESEGVYIFIEDDGKGFSQLELQEKHRKKHFGLQGMTLRAQQIGGTLTVNSRTADSDMESGTEIMLFIPIGAFEK